MKGAVEVLTRYWAQELGPRGIAVNAVAPGPVSTDFAGGYIRDSGDVQNAMAGLTALGRVASPADVAATVVALAGSAGEWVTAQRIEVSGGFRR
jgi:NAD(P)-dependent dehydrogenase (short-subunit alcohol dehydrogenase family)